REVEEKVPSLAQPLVDREAAVEPRVVDEALPADGRARLLEVHAHDDADLARVLIRELLEPAPVLERGVGIVDRARPDHEEEPIVFAAQHARHFRTTPRDGLRT